MIILNNKSIHNKIGQWIVVFLMTIGGCEAAPPPPSITSSPGGAVRTTTVVAVVNRGRVRWRLAAYEPQSGAYAVVVESRDIQRQ